MRHGSHRRWSAAALARTRGTRIALLAVGTGGWALVALGIVDESDVAVIAGALGAAAATVAAMKLAFEGRSELVAATSRRDHVASLATEVSQLRRATERLEAELARLADDAVRRSDHVTRHSAELAALAAGLAAFAAGLERFTHATEGTAAALTATRELLDKVAVRTPSKVSADRLAGLAATNVTDPLLSIAIPSFNRPRALAECLLSIEGELAGIAPGQVEVCITDDASMDPETLEIAAEFAERVPCVSLRRQPANVGLERNILASCEPCRGEHVLIMGNDDKFVEGALAIVVDDLRRIDPSVYLFERQRIRVDGSPHPPVPGTDPIDIPPGEGHLFSTLLQATRRRGFLSTLGFTSHVVFRRQPFVTVDASRYLDLTLYARVFVLIEAFANDRLFFRNAPVVFHRTPTTSQKHAESVGRGEEQFMAGAAARSSRYFGTTFAAALERLVERGAVAHTYLADLPETLMTPIKLVDWIAANRAIDGALDEHLGAGVVSDADKFFAALEAVIDTGAID